MPVAAILAPGQTPMMWHLYLLRCADGSLYTGISTDVEHRIQAHRTKRGARYLRGRGPFELVYCAPIGNRSQAQRIEYRVKSLRRADKERLVQGEAELPRIDDQWDNRGLSCNGRSRAFNKPKS